GCIQTGGIIAKIVADEDVTLEEVDAEKDVKVAEKDVDAQRRLEESQAQVYHIDLEHADKVLKVVTAATTTITAAPSAARRRKGVKRKAKQDNAVLIYQALKRKPQTEAQAKKNRMVYLKNMAGFKMDFFKEKAIKNQKLDEEVEELKTHLQIISNDEDDVYTEATPLALKVPVVDYQIHTKNNKPCYKIIRANGTHQLFLSFISLLRNFDREDFEILWQIVQERMHL
nr:hypothetical protein [Tanacetum cinerariifolium]